MRRKTVLLMRVIVGALLACMSTGTAQEEISSTIQPVLPTPQYDQTEVAGLYLSEVQQEQLLQLLFTNGGCDLPCFWGIVPGETSWDFTKAFLGTFHEMDTGQLWYEDDALPAYVLPLQFVDSKNRVIDSSLVLTVGDQKVQRINVYADADSASDLNSYWGYYSLRFLFSQLGAPTQIFFDIYMKDLGNYPDYNVVFLYQEKKIAFWLSGESQTDNRICPQIKEKGEPTNLRISIADPESKLGIYPPDWEFWSLRDDEDFLTTEELFGISEEEFYRQILVDNVDCFTVK